MRQLLTYNSGPAWPRGAQRLSVRAGRRTLLERLAFLVQPEARLPQIPHDTLGELLPGVIRHVLFENPAQQVAAPRDRKTDRKDELIAKTAVIHRYYVLVLFKTA
jgi:hypothetical protein